MNEKNVLHGVSGLFALRDILEDQNSFPGDDYGQLDYESNQPDLDGPAYIEVLIELIDQKLDTRTLDWLEELGAWGFIYFSPCLSFCIESSIETVADHLASHPYISQAIRVQSMRAVFESEREFKVPREDMSEQDDLHW